MSVGCKELLDQKFWMVTQSDLVLWAIEEELVSGTYLNLGVP